MLRSFQGLISGIPFLSFAVLDNSSSQGKDTWLLDGCLLLAIIVTGHAAAFFSSGLYNHMSNSVTLIFSTVVRRFM
ncbi:hypothetical protein J3E68DRAFT_415310 [Trichoderma sp. SZMC 28012]